MSFPCITDTLSDFICGLTLERVPAAVQHEARRFLLDTLGCALAGAGSELAPHVRAVAGLLGKGSLPAAAYTAARLANCLDLDETYPGGPVAGLHFGASVFGEAFASCWHARLTTKELLLAAVCGYELGGRVSDVGTQMGIEGGRFTSMPQVWGLALAPTLGAAAAAARLEHQNAATFARTMGVAASGAAMPTGPLWSRQTALPQCFDAGWAAVTGGFAARSAALGEAAIPAILDGTPNIFTMAGMHHVDPDGLVGELGERWALQEIIYKPWPSCRFHHHALTGLEQLRAAEPFGLDAIEEITIGVNKARLAPRFFNSEPETFVARQFSFPHSVSMLLLGVPPGAQWSSQRWHTDAAARALRAKVKFADYPRAATAPEHFVRGQFRQMPCFVEVRLPGRTLRSEIDFARGDPWTARTRFADDDLVAKFREVSQLPTDAADTIVETLLFAPAGADLAPLMRALA